eukprot:763663-Hanusia_phi.AAC.2
MEIHGGGEGGGAFSVVDPTWQAEEKRTMIAENWTAIEWDVSAIFVIDTDDKGTHSIHSTLPLSAGGSETSWTDLRRELERMRGALQIRASEVTERSEGNNAAGEKHQVAVRRPKWQRGVVFSEEAADGGDETVFDAPVMLAS